MVRCCGFFLVFLFNYLSYMKSSSDSVYIDITTQVQIHNYMITIFLALLPKTSHFIGLLVSMNRYVR